MAVMAVMATFAPLAAFTTLATFPALAVIVAVGDTPGDLGHGSTLRSSRSAGQKSAKG
jgi:hypothetical protein